MKNNVRLSAIPSTIAMMVVVGLLAGFIGHWGYYSVEMKRQSIQEVRLQKDMAELSKYRNWTLDYCRIYTALEILSKNKMSQEQMRLLCDEIWILSRNYGFNPLLIPAIVFQESMGNPNAKGRYRSGAESGAYGLMQVKVMTAQAIGKRFGLQIENADDLMRPEVSVVVGSAYLMRLVGRYGNLKKAIIAYNLGQGSVDSKIRSGEPLPTFYYEGVLAKYRKLQQLVDERMGETPTDF
ncbi:MAG: transglycosylase SLT domain-containing protein [Fibrobacter sp.]|nr:transglycosylase SLT domain-containing protein [Fibrobacter sp.]